MARRSNRLLYFVVAVVLAIVAVGLAVRFGRTDEEKTATSEFTVVEEKLIFEGGTGFLAFAGGTVKTSAAVDLFFVNVEGIGFEDLSYASEKKITTKNNTYYLYTFEAESSILNTFFNNDMTVNLSVYAEYDGLNYKVKTTSVTVLSGWTEPY